MRGVVDDSGGVVTKTAWDLDDPEDARHKLDRGVLWIDFVLVLDEQERGLCAETPPPHQHRHHARRQPSSAHDPGLHISAD